MTFPFLSFNHESSVFEAQPCLSFHTPTIPFPKLPLGEPWPGHESLLACAVPDLHRESDRSANPICLLINKEQTGCVTC